MKTTAAAWGNRPPAVVRAMKIRDAAKRIIADAQRGPAFATAVEQHLHGLGRAQVVDVCQILFHELAAMHQSQRK